MPQGSACRHGIPTDCPCSDCAAWALRPAPADTSLLTFFPPSRSLWARLRRLWHREGITKAHGDQP